MTYRIMIRSGGELSGWRKLEERRGSVLGTSIEKSTTGRDTLKSFKIVSSFFFFIYRSNVKSKVVLSLLLMSILYFSIYLYMYIL